MFKSIAVTGLLLSTAGASTIFVQPGNTFVTQAFLPGRHQHSFDPGSLAYQFDLSFDPAILAPTGVTAGLFLSGGTGFIPGTIDNVAGNDQLYRRLSHRPGSGSFWRRNAGHYSVLRACGGYKFASRCSNLVFSRLSAFRHRD